MITSKSRDFDEGRVPRPPANIAVQEQVLRHLNPARSPGYRLTRAVRPRRMVYEAEWAKSTGGSARVGFRIVRNMTRRGPTGDRKVVALGHYDTGSGRVFLHDITRGRAVPAAEHPLLASTKS